MTKKDAEKLADKIFDMIEGNWPRGLVKSDLVDLIAGFRWDDEEPQMPALGDILREHEALEEIRQLFGQHICGND